MHLFRIFLNQSLTISLALVLVGCITYMPASREDRYQFNAATCERRPNGDECAIKGKHAYYLGRKDEARELWINSCFVHRRPNACSWLRRDFPQDYETRRREELMRKPTQKPVSECREPYDSIRWVAQYCLEVERQSAVMHPEVLGCIDRSTGKVFDNDCDRAIFFKGRWCKSYIDRVASQEAMTLDRCVSNPDIIPQGVKDGFMRVQ